MSFTTTMFDELILELGELATMRDDAQHRPELASLPAVKEATQALAEAVTAMAQAALAEGGAPEIALARIALSRAQRLFCPVNAILAEARAAQERVPAVGSPVIRALSLPLGRSRTV